MKLSKDRDIIKSNIELIENFSQIKQEKFLNNVGFFCYFLKKNLCFFEENHQ